nr:MAG TPA: hypothetical protein [Caudoviricetes sp.]
MQRLNLWITKVRTDVCINPFYVLRNYFFRNSYFYLEGRFVG